MTDEFTPNPIDVHVGTRIRLRRRMLGVSQERLAEALQLTFQQVQKYERGANRVSASKLWEISRFLEVPVSWFFDGLKDGADGGAIGTSALDRLGGAAGGLELAEIFVDLAPSFRRAVLRVAEALADATPPAAEPDTPASVAAKAGQASEVMRMAERVLS